MTADQDRAEAVAEAEAEAEAMQRQLEAVEWAAKLSRAQTLAEAEALRQKIKAHQQAVQRGPLTPYGEQVEATRMGPEVEAVYWREQYQHAERQCEEMQAVLHQRLAELGEAYATIRTLMRMAHDLGTGGLR